MAAVPPPQGLNESDYDAIEAAVTETVRGRWFLNEFARRNRVAETRQLLDAMARLEASVASNQVALPSADPSIRLLIQRIKEIAGQLGALAGDMRSAGIDMRYIDAVDSQARAVAGMMRGPAQVRQTPPRELPKATTASEPQAGPAFSPSSYPQNVEASTSRGDQSSSQITNDTTVASHATNGEPRDDIRLAALSGLDRLTLAQKLELFA